MDDKERSDKEAFFQLLRSFEKALGIIAGAVARSVDAERFQHCLHQQITNAESSKLVTPLAIHLSTAALAAVEAVRLEKLADDPNQHKHRASPHHPISNQTTAPARFHSYYHP